MKTIRYTLIMLLACLTLNSCQDIEEPVNNIPTVTTDAVKMYEAGTFAALSGSVTSKAECYFLISPAEDMIPARIIEADVRYDSELEEYVCNSEVSDLISGTTYYVALCATDGRSEVRGNVVSFTTTAYLSIESVRWNGEMYSADVIGVYLANDNQFVPSGYGNMIALRNSTDISSYDLRKNVVLNEPSIAYAYSPYDDTYPGSALDEIDVRTYGYNDYLYGSCEVTPTNPKANIELKSALAKLHFVFSTDNEEDITINSINLCNTNKEIEDEALSISGKLDLATGEISPTSILGHDGIVRKLDYNNVIHSGISTYSEMLVIPTTFGNEEIVLNVQANGDFVQVPIAGTTWEKGKTYEIAIKVNVEDKKAKVGDYYYSDGTWSTSYNENKECIGIVFALSDDKDGKINVSLKESKHGRIVALEDVGYANADFKPSSSGSELTQYDLSPYYKTLDEERLAGYLPYDGKCTYSNQNSDSERLPYNYYDWVYNSSNIRPAGSYALLDYSGKEHTDMMMRFNVAASILCSNYAIGEIQWYLPSIGELTRLGMTISIGYINIKTHTCFKMPIDESYWSSTINSKDISCQVWGYHFNSGYVSTYSQDRELFIRPIASF